MTQCYTLHRIFRQGGAEHTEATQRRTGERLTQPFAHSSAITAITILLPLLRFKNINICTKPLWSSIAVFVQSKLLAVIDKPVPQPHLIRERMFKMARKHHIASLIIHPKMRCTCTALSAHACGVAA